MTPPSIHRVTALDLKVQPWAWPFAQERRAEIDAHFAEAQRERPNLWNGRVLLGRSATFEGERLSASYFETDFASFLAWRDWGFPDRGVFNGFGMGALLASDGAFVLGEMGHHTSNPDGSTSHQARLISMTSGARRSILPAASHARWRRRRGSPPPTIVPMRIGIASSPASPLP